MSPENEKSGAGNKSFTAMLLNVLIVILIQGEKKYFIKRDQGFSILYEGPKAAFHILPWFLLVKGSRENSSPTRHSAVSRARCTAESVLHS